MDLGIISVRYARALLKSATQIGIENQIYNEAQRISESYVQVVNLRSSIENPMLSKDTKLQFMAMSYITLYRKQKRIIRGKLTTAAPVTPCIKSKMQKVVEAKTQGTVEFITEVDPDIIGGFILEYDTYKMDASVKSKLRSFLSQLKK